VQDQPALRAASVDTGAVYERTRRELVATVAALTDEQLVLRVPATPAWSVKDVLAHVVGLAADLNGQRFPEPDDVGGVAWAANQVTRRHSSTVDELTGEWDREAEMFEDGLRAFGYEFGSHFAADLYVHYCDVRSAIGVTPDADELTVAVALDHYLGYVAAMLADANWGTLEIAAGQEIRRLGTEHPARARLRAEPVELLRALSARRSERQIRALDWEGDVDGFLALVRTALSGGYSLPEADLVD
jgi:hypothetical protein